MKERGAPAQYQATIAELTQSVLDDNDLSSFMRRIVRGVARNLTADCVALWQTSSDGGAFTLLAADGPACAAVDQTTAAADSHAFTTATLVSSRPLLVPDWEGEQRSDRPALPPAGSARWSIGARIGGQDGAFGVLEAHGAGRCVPGADEATFMEAVANVLAIAVRQAQLVADAQDKAVWEERQRLARDLHDSVTQALYGVTLHAQAARRLFAASEHDAAQHSLRTLQETAQEALDEMRLLIFELRPPILEQAGLVAALQARLEAVEGRVNLQTELTVEGVGHLPAQTEQALYRIAQEALNNALKHASAKHIHVRLQQTPERVTLEISDDGKGFDTAVTRAAASTGLRGITERVTQLGGILTMWSAPGAGAVLRVEVAP